MKKLVMFLITSLLCVNICGCSKNTPHEIMDTSKEIVNVSGEVDLTNAKPVTIGENVYLSFAEVSNQKENVAFSPVSLNYALGMVYLGANNGTSEEIGKYFGCDAKSLSTGHLTLSEGWSENDNVDVMVSNAVICDKELPLLRTYQEDLLQYYNAKVSNQYSFDTEADAVANEINEFCKESTNGMIPSVVNPETIKEVHLAVINALYFNGKWAKPFQDRELSEEAFQNGDGTQSNVTMMSQSGNCYFENKDAVGFSKSYEGGKFEFIGILPKEKICDANGDFKMDQIDLESLLESRTYEYDVNYKFPKFKVESDLNLDNALCQTSLAAMYSNTADFSNMSDHSLFVNSVIQKVVIDVNEEGTEASAVTLVTIKANSYVSEVREVKNVVLDRPFLFLIYDRENEEILFLGRISHL